MKPYYETKLGKLYLGDAKEVLQSLDEDSVDLIITDPPYSRKYFYTYSYLSDYCPRLMKRGSSLLMIAPSYALPEVTELFKNKLKFRWIISLDTSSGSHPRLKMGIEVAWKPVLWYVKESFAINKYNGYIKDSVKIENTDGQIKKLHKWQQSEDWCYYLIKRLSLENEVVLDPFIGSGTVAAVCEKLNRRWIGIDIDEESCKTTIYRLNSFYI